jgi:hypothetical protein
MSETGKMFWFVPTRRPRVSVSMATDSHGEGLPSATASLWICSMKSCHVFRIVERSR